MVEVKNISKKYGSHTALENLSFVMEPGRIYGLLGPNGAGKSTTMNIMTGYIAPTSGEVSIDGYDIYEDAKHAKQKLGYLPENPPLYQDMTVHEYLMFVAELKGVKRKERFLAVETVMEDTGIVDVANQLIRTLSKGYRQRVGFAGAIVNDPQVIILDEPTVGLDPKQIIEFRELIRRLGEEHIVLISSHILSEISEVCDHVFIINGGKLIVDDAVENLDQYADSGSRIHITFKGDAEEAEEALLDLFGVKDVKVSDEDTLIVEVDGNHEELAEQISLALMEKRIPILGMQEEKGSLEQIFLEVTDADAQGNGLDRIDGEPEVISWDAENEIHTSEEGEPASENEASDEQENVPEEVSFAEQENASEDESQEADEPEEEMVYGDMLSEEIEAVSEDALSQEGEATPETDASAGENEPETMAESSEEALDRLMEQVSSEPDRIGGMMNVLFDPERKEENI